LKLAVVGTGYVGLVTGVVLAEKGHEVLCVDNDLQKVDKIRKGIPPIYEPGLEEVLKQTLANGNFRITDSIAEACDFADVIFIAVGTPPGDDGTPDIAAVKAVAHEIGKNIKHYMVVVVKSTVPVGTGDLVENIIESYGVRRELFDVVSNPEFLREGTALDDTRNPDRLILGVERQEPADILLKLFECLPSPSLVTNRRSSELIKYASNSFLAVKISFANAMSRVCELCGANVAQVMKGVGMDARIGPAFLQAGLGWGGSCLPKDVQGMISVARNWGYDFDLLRATVVVNQHQTAHFINRLENRLHGVSGKKIALLGLTFKPNTDDLRDSRSLIILESLLRNGALVTAYDPVANEAVKKLHPEAKYAKNAYEAAKDADAVIIATEWNEFKELDLKKLAEVMKQRILFDGRLVFNRKDVEAAGLEYFVVGERNVS